MTPWLAYRSAKQQPLAFGGRYRVRLHDVGVVLRLRQVDRNGERTKLHLHEAVPSERILGRAIGPEVQRMPAREITRRLDDRDLLLPRMEEIETDERAAARQHA